MAKGTPYIIDFILDSPQDFDDMKIKGVNDVVKVLYQTSVKTVDDLSLSEGMEFYYRGAFLAWLVKHSSPEQRALARKLLSHIMHSTFFTLGCRGAVHRYISCKDVDV